MADNPEQRILQQVEKMVGYEPIGMRDLLHILIHPEVIDMTKGYLERNTKDNLCIHMSGEYPCRKTRVKIIVEVDLDPIPGWGHQPGDYVDMIKRELNERVPHYHPEVRVSE